MDGWIRISNKKYKKTKPTTLLWPETDFVFGIEGTENQIVIPISSGVYIFDIAGGTGK